MLRFPFVIFLVVLAVLFTVPKVRAQGIAISVEGATSGSAFPADPGVVWDLGEQEAPMLRFWGGSAIRSAGRCSCGCDRSVRMVVASA